MEAIHESLIRLQSGASGSSEASSSFSPSAGMLTLVDFPSEYGEKVFDAVELCSETNKNQVVEINRISLGDLGGNEKTLAIGLALVYYPSQECSSHIRMVRKTLKRLSKNKRLVVVPVIEPGATVERVNRISAAQQPVYLTMCSCVLDYAAVFQSFLFTAQLREV
jgi:hypothetical protein